MPKLKTETRLNRDLIKTSEEIINFLKSFKQMDDSIMIFDADKNHLDVSRQLYASIVSATKNLKTANELLYQVGSRLTEWEASIRRYIEKREMTENRNRSDIGFSNTPPAFLQFGQPLQSKQLQHVPKSLIFSSTVSVEEPPSEDDDEALAENMSNHSLQDDD